MFFLDSRIDFYDFYDFRDSSIVFSKKNLICLIHTWISMIFISFDSHMDFNDFHYVLYCLMDFYDFYDFRDSLIGCLRLFIDFHNSRMYFFNFQNFLNSHIDF